jgi:hypothetical protein
MNKPGRVSDGLFDLMDLFKSSLALGGIEDKISMPTYLPSYNFQVLQTLKRATLVMRGVSPISQ